MCVVRDVCVCVKCVCVHVCVRDVCVCVCV